MKSRLALCLALFALTATAAWAGGAKVQVCHIPPGNPSNFHTITISESALQAHLSHGDLPGTCSAHCDTLCSDGDPCTIDACDANEHCLIAHPPVNCDDSNPCTTDSCDPAAGCLSVPKVCTDSNLCTIDACDPLTGSCVFPPVACSEGQTCNPSTGGCETELSCPCTSMADFNQVLANAVSCTETSSSTTLFDGSGVGAFSYTASASPRWCGVLYDAGPDFRSITADEATDCIQFLHNAAALRGLTCN